MAEKKFDAQKEVVNIVDDIRHYFAKNGTPDTKAVIGISGGKDSTIAAALLAMALGSDRVVGVLMPEHEQKDIQDSIRVCTILGIKYYAVDIGGAMDALVESMPEEIFGQRNEFFYTNTPARLRMTTLYGIAALIGGRVINTGNASEAYVGYTTKYGDLAGDYAVLRDYYVREVYQIGEVLMKLTNLPRELIYKAPADGMSGKADEDNMGFTYEELDAYLIDGQTPPADILHNITERHNRNKHKEAINLPHPRSVTRPYRYSHGGCYEDLSPFRNEF